MFIQIELTKLILIIIINIINNDISVTGVKNDCFHKCYGVVQCIADCEDELELHPKRRPPPKDLNRSIPTSSRSKKQPAHYMRLLKSQLPAHCGLRQVAGSEPESGEGLVGMGRIVGGEDAEPNEYPWLVSLQLKRDGKPLKHFCGAAILNENYILTAAHCTDSLQGKESTVIIKAGINKWNEKGGQTLYPEKFIVHKGWSAEKQINDISVIKLMNPVRFKTNSEGKYIINSVCLPTKTNEPKGYVELAGWGQLAEDKSSPDWLQKISMPIWKRAQCRKNYKEYMAIKKSHICAGGYKGNQDSCMGDSGGPLVQTRDEKTTQIGIVSFGIPCAVKGLPGVYTYLVHFMDWIYKHIN